MREGQAWGTRNLEVDKVGEPDRQAEGAHSGGGQHGMPLKGIFGRREGEAGCGWK